MRIAIVKLSALGDIVHAMIVLQFIKNFNLDISIDWIVEDHFKELLHFHPHINEVHTLKLKKIKKNKSLILLFNELAKLRKLESYDIVIDMQGLIKSAIVSKLIPGKKTIGFDKDSIKEGLASVFYSHKFNYDYSKNVIKRNLRLIEFALQINISKLQIQQKDPFLFSKSNKLAQSLSNSKKNIILIPGASHSSKCYPTSKFAELTFLINANFLVILGSKEEEIMAKEIRELSSKVTVCNKLTLSSLILLISKVDLVIGPDTGPTHMAWALNIPSIILFGLTPGYRNTMQTPKNRAIESESKVNPFKIDKMDESIKNIEVNKIIQVSNKILDLSN